MLLHRMHKFYVHVLEAVGAMSGIEAKLRYVNIGLVSCFFGSRFSNIEKHSCWMLRARPGNAARHVLGYAIMRACPLLAETGRFEDVPVQT